MLGMMGCTSTQAAASNKPRTWTLAGAAAAKASRLVNTPRPPAEQPPNNRFSVSPLLPRPWRVTSACRVADTMREPRKLKPKVLELAAASPNQPSEEQYLMNTMLNCAKGLVLISLPKMPSWANRLFQPDELMSNLSVA